MIGCRRAMAAAGREVPLQVQVTIETDRPHAPRHRDRRRAHRARGDAARRHRPQLRHRPGRDDRAPPLPRASTRRMPISCLPNAGLPSVVDGQHALRPHARASSPSYHAPLRHRVRRQHRRRLLRHHARAPAPRSSRRCRDLDAGRRARRCTSRALRRSTRPVPFDQDTSFLIIGERTNANGSKKFRDAMLDGDWDTCVQMASEQVKEGAHVLDVCVDYVGRDGTVDMDEIAAPLRHPGQRRRSCSTPPSRQVIEAGLQRHRRQGDPQLGQPRGRRGRRAPASTACCRSPASTAPRSSAC